MNETNIQQGLWQDLRSGSQIVIPNFTPLCWQECDIYQITKAGFAVEFEIKISVSDFRADKKKVDKHRALSGETIAMFGGRAMLRPKRFWYVMPADIAENVRSEIPDYAGLMIAKPWGIGAAIRREKEAPNLPSEKVTQENVRRMYVNFYWRYWEMRRVRYCKEGER